mgnify:FL=1
MQKLSPEDRRAHLKRVLVGSAFGLLAGLGCPHLPEELQFPCRVTLALIHATVNP